MVTSHHQSRRAWFERLLLVAVLIPIWLPIWSSQVSAHQGPPFNVIMDKKAGPCIVSIWADPDIGTGTFFIIVDAPKGGAIPDDLRVEVGVRPVSGRLAEALYPATRQALRGQVQYQAAVEIDAQELWQTRIILHSLQGDGEVTAQVEATPPGYGRWDVLLYFFPFAAVGLLWLRAVLRRKALNKAKTG